MVKGPASFIESFGDTIFDGDIFTFPSNAKSWGGFANMDLDLYPFSFVNGGSVEFYWFRAIKYGGEDKVQI